MADPIRLSDVLAEISRLYGTMKHSLDRKSLEALGKRLIFLRKTINDDILKVLNIVNAAGELSSDKLDQWQAQPPAWRLDLLKKLEERIILEDSVELSEFFANVSTAVINAQKNLNAFSGQYVDELEKKNSRIPPTYFAIPNIKAEMKLGFSELTSKGVNVILFKNEEQKKQYVESTVTFELVAAPPLPAPPPGTEQAPIESVEEEGIFFEIPSGETGVGLEEIVFTGKETLEIAPPMRESEESTMDLLESLRLARASLFAATDRLLETRTEVAQEKKEPTAPSKKKAAAAKGKTTRKSTAKKTAKKASVKKTPASKGATKSSKG